MKRAIVLLLSVMAFHAQAGDSGGDNESVDVEPSDGYSPDEAQSHETLRLTGYFDIGFAKATGNGSSFLDADTRVPLDYGVDAFAPAVNARGDVASTNANGRFTNGFLPRSMGIGSTPSFMINTASADVRFQPNRWPVFLFARLQVMPRLTASGDTSRVELQQAFGRLTPFSAHEFAVSLGRFDSVFGIEYLENEANLRVGITPSLIARYTTGQSLGLKLFYRFQIPVIWSAFSLNVAATNSGTRIEALVPIDASLVGVPVGSGRFGYELNLQSFQAKVGLSGLYGLRNDQHSGTALQRGFGVDLRLNFFGVAISGEMVRLIDDRSAVPGKVTGQGVGEVASGFEVWGEWGRLAWTLPWKGEVVTAVTLAGRYDHRRARFEGYTWVETDRITASLRIDLFDVIALKGEALFNRELSGAPNVDNDVFTASCVLTW